MNSNTTLLCLFLFMVSTVVSYDPKLAKKMAYFAASAEFTEAEINSWTCKTCSYSKLVSVISSLYLYRLKSSAIKFSMYLVTLDTLKNSMQ